MSTPSFGRSVSDFMNKKENPVSDTYSKAREQAIVYLGIAKKTTGKVRNKLIEKGYSEPIIEQVIVDLSDMGYLDDLFLARSYVRRKWGQGSCYYLKNKMTQAGFTSKVIQAVLSESEANDRELAQVFYSKKDLSCCLDKDLNSRKDPQVNRLIKQGISRGFSYQICLDAIRFSMDVG